MIPDKFYKSEGWRLAREDALARDNHLCQRCKQQGILTPANIVHHIEPIDVAPEKALDLDNLMSVCAKCHNILHPEKGILQKGERKIEVIMGYPASGKSTYVESVFEYGDIVLDLDRIITAISFREHHDRTGNILPTVQIANDIFTSTLVNIRSKGFSFGKLYVIRSRLSDAEYSALRAARAKYYWLDVDKKTCRKRLWNSGRRDVIEALDKCDRFLATFPGRLTMIPQPKS